MNACEKFGFRVKKKNHTCLAQDSNVVFKLQRSNKVLELTYLGEIFCV